ncbi:uncharacterized protein [Sinocyclocheilus grahami]|uniref:uncharacterized protein n=1 Tax=Sinocyclocheilus grahami TaxID=75366 RepID=UPI0007AC5A5C|nr:PREDICTED: uncharacterized protein LOC107571673 [Sinocyclocheilus grahami]
MEDWDTQMDGAEERWPKRAAFKMSSMYAVVTLRDSDEVMVAASNWLNTDKTQCHWPPFRSAEKYMQAVKDRTEPSTAGKPWDMLNILLHAEYDTYQEATTKKEELVRAQKDGLYAVITLQESSELTVIPTNWLNEHKTQCYWPPFKAPKTCTEAVKNRLEPARGENPWEMLNIIFHEQHATFEQAKEREEALRQQTEPPSTSFGCLERQNSPLRSGISTGGFSSQTTVISHGIKRKREESPDITARPLMTTDMEIRNKAKQVIERVMAQIQTTTNALKPDIVSEAFLDPENPVLEATETEIPKLRDVLKNLNKNINRKLTRDYVNEAKGVLSLIQGVQLDADENMTKAKVHSDLEINLHRALKELKCQFDSCYKTLEDCLSAGVEESVRSCVKTTQDMIESARPKDNRGFHKIYRAMCERKGYYWPKAWDAPLELNTCLSKHMYDNLDEEFELIFP